MDTIMLNPQDNVAVALREIAPDESLQVGEGVVRTLERIPCGHKIALTAIAAGDLVLKYGMAVGRAEADIPKGGHVHVHNITSLYMDNVQNHYE